MNGHIKKKMDELIWKNEKTSQWNLAKERDI